MREYEILLEGGFMEEAESFEEALTKGLRYLVDEGGGNGMIWRVVDRESGEERVLDAGVVLVDLGKETDL